MMATFPTIVIKLEEEAEELLRTVFNSTNVKRCSSCKCQFHFSNMYKEDADIAKRDCSLKSMSIGPNGNCLNYKPLIGKGEGIPF